MSRDGHFLVNSSPVTLYECAEKRAKYAIKCLIYAKNFAEKSHLLLHVFYFNAAAKVCRHLRESTSKLTNSSKHYKNLLRMNSLFAPSWEQMKCVEMCKIRRKYAKRVPTALPASWVSDAQTLIQVCMHMLINNNK